MKRFVAMFLSMTLILSCIPIQVFALENTWDDDGVYSDMEREPFGGGSGDLRDTEEKTFSNEEYGYTLTVTPVREEIQLRTGTALRYSLEAVDSWQVEAEGVYGNTLVVTASHDTEGEYTLFVSMINGSVMHALSGTNFEFHPVLSGTFREWTAPDALYLYQFGSRKYGDYVLCDDPDTVSPLLLVEGNETYDVFNTETGKYFDYDFERFSFESNDDYYIADGVLIGYTSSPSEEMFCITETGEPLFEESIQPLYLDETLHFIVQNDEGKYGVYNLDGTAKIYCKYDHISDYSGQAAIVRDGSYYYAANENGPLCGTETYTSMSSFLDGVAVGLRASDSDPDIVTADLIFDDSRPVLDLAEQFNGKYATVHNRTDSFIHSIDPSAICVEVESYIDGWSGGYPAKLDYVLNFRGIINASGEVVRNFGDTYDFAYNSYFDQENSLYYSGKNSFMEIEKINDSVEGQQYLATKNGNIIEIPAGADYEYVKDNYLLIHNSEDAGGGSYLLDEKGEEIWSSEEPVSAPSNKNHELLSPHIILESGVFFLETKAFREFSRDRGFTVSPASGEVNEDLLVLEDEEGNYFVFNETGEILSGLPAQPYITPANRVLAAVDHGSFLPSTTNYVYELQYYDEDGEPLWAEDTYFSLGALNDYPGNTDYLYGILVLTATSRGYLDLDGDVLVAPEYKSLYPLLPGQLLFGETESAGVLLDAQSGDVIAEIDFGRNGRIYSETVRNGAVFVENGDFTQYVIYPWAEGGPGG